MSVSSGSHFGPYVVESRLGAGGMGVVYVATDTRLGRRVALKVVTGSLADSAEFRERFAREATVLARVDSPHIVSIFEHGEHDGAPFIATQLVAGGDLTTMLRTRGPIAPATALDIADQLAEALEDAHRAGVVHRDVKPGNVLVRDPDADHPFVYLCDFGIAQTDAKGLTATGLVTGSWEYLAPERIAGEPGTPASDVYALGCVLWTCLTGQPPYVGSVLEVAEGHRDAPVPSLPGDDVTTAHINRILHGCLAKDPAHRFAGAAELRRALADPTTVRPRPAGPRPSAPPPSAAGPTQPPSPTYPPPRGRRRGALVAAAVLTLALIGGGVTAVIAFRGDDKPSAGPRTDPPDPTSGSGDPGATARPTKGTLETADAAKIAKALREVAEPLPGSYDLKISATSWTASKANLGRGWSPRRLPANDRAQATSWTITAQGYEDIGKTYLITVEHIPPDAPDGGYQTCDSFSGTTSFEVECREIRAPDGRPVYEIWIHSAAPGTPAAVAHYYQMPGDGRSGMPRIDVTEYFALDRKIRSVEAAKKDSSLPSSTVMNILLDPRLVLPLPDPTPDLPSITYCSLTFPTPDECPQV